MVGVRLVRGELACLVWHTELGAGECGGGNREWDVAEQEGTGELVYIKEGEVLIASLWSKEKKVLVPGGHTQKVNVVKQFMCGKERYLATGGEETNIRVYRVLEKECKEVAVLRGHLSSVKCLAVEGVGERMFLVQWMWEGRGEGVEYGQGRGKTSLLRSHDCLGGQIARGRNLGCGGRGGDEIPGGGHQVGGGGGHNIDLLYMLGYDD